MMRHDLLGLQVSKLAFLFNGHTVRSMDHIVVCLAIFGKAETVQKYTYKENK